MSQPRVLMIGLDAAELSFIRASLGVLPTFSRLVHEAPCYSIRSTAEHFPASVWPTMYTGTMPGEHGITQHIQWDPARMCLRRVSADWMYCEPFWYDLARAGLGVTVLDVPFTFPNRLPQVTEVLNWGSHDLMGRFHANPPALAREIRRRFGRHPMGYEIPVFKGTRQLTVMARECVEGARRKARLARWLRDATPWNFFCTVFGECHRAGHLLWREDDEMHGHVPQGALLEVYRALDKAVGVLLEGIDTRTTTVVVSSLHGMGANFAQEHFIRPVMDLVNGTFYGRGSETYAQSNAKRGLIRRLREAVPARAQHAAARVVPVQARDWIVEREVTGGIDWNRTPGFALRSDMNSYVRLNLIGREARGIVPPHSADHRRYVDSLTESLLALRAAHTDRPIVSDVVSAPDVFQGRRREFLPDFIIRWAGKRPVSNARMPGLGTIHAPPERGRTGEHRFKGFAFVLGPGARSEGLPPLAHSRDFPAFISHLLGVRR